MAKQKVLIAEDSRIERELYEEIISNTIYDKVIVTDGEAAVKSYQDRVPDIIILDIHMPLMNGFQVLKKIRSEHNDKRTTIIMVTSSSEKTDIVACAKYGIQGYVIKPIKPTEFNQAIAKYHRANLDSQLEKN